MQNYQKKSLWKWLLISLLIFFIWQEFNQDHKLRSNRKESIPRAITPVSAQLSSDEQNTIDIFEKMSPSVVFIKNASLRRDFFSFNIYEIPIGAGSGFIWDAQGHIVTNFHVIYNADKIDVILSDNSYNATVVGVAPDYDLAVLHIDIPDKKLSPIPLGRSQDLKVGQNVFAIGNPFGLDRSLSKGVISALGRSIQSLTGHSISNVIQTDTAINPGNSGGPLLDSYGRLIGVTTAIYSPSGASSGVGFAVPVDTVNRIVPQIITQGKITRAGLGITLVPDKIRETFNLEGALVLQVLPESSAQKAGVTPTTYNSAGELVIGDLIVKIDGKDIRKNDDLTAYIENNKNVGDSIEIELIRNGTHHTATAVLQAL